MDLLLRLRWLKLQNRLRAGISISVFALIVLSALLSTSAYGVPSSKRVLVVTTDPDQGPQVYSIQAGTYVITDLVAAGYPFDVVTYTKFMDMALGDHDVIILNGHISNNRTPPITTADILAKCRTAITDGRKVFINGTLPFKRYDSLGKQLENNNYATSLFHVSLAGSCKVSGIPAVPAGILKDPSIAAKGLTGNWITPYTFNTQPAMLISVNGFSVGFLYPQGGALCECDYSDYIGNLLDYGRVVSYLRYGYPSVLGFANDRIDGKPIASFEVHCDTTNNLGFIDGVNNLAKDFDLPLVNLLVYANLTPESITKWNSVAGPLMRIGSHSRTHPMDWPSLPSALYQSREALNDQKNIANITSTCNYFNFSGSMNPTSTQIEDIFNSGVIFGAGGAEERGWKMRSGEWMNVQRVPTRLNWLKSLSQSAVPYCLSQTVQDDYPVYVANENYLDSVRTDFEANLKYGMYSYGYIHDYMMSSPSGCSTNNVLMSTQIRSAMQYLKDQGAKFVFTDDLILRLRDYLGGWVDYTVQNTYSNGDPKTLVVTVTRPSRLINQVKIECLDGLAPTASGAGVVLSQHKVGRMLYVDLAPDVTSTFTVDLAPASPDPPIVTASKYSSGTIQASWSAPNGPYDIAEYQYAVGSAPGGSDIQTWRSAGLLQSVTISSLNLIHGTQYYVSVKVRSTQNSWSIPAASNSVLADMTPPSTPVVIDDGAIQPANDSIHATWSSYDTESGVTEYKYCVGTTSGASDVVHWTSAATSTGLTINSPDFATGRTYFISVQSKNGAEAWSAIGSSDGISMKCDGTVGGAKQCPDNSKVDLQSVKITAVFDDCIYVEQPNRSSGIKVLYTGQCNIGDTITLFGDISTDDGERVIKHITSASPTSGTKLKPLAMNGRALGGGTFMQFTPGTTDGFGLNNVGLLVTIWGKVTDTGDNYFYVDDGSGLQANNHIGVRVDSRYIGIPNQGDFVTITGINSLYYANGHYYPCILPRIANDLLRSKTQSLLPIQPADFYLTMMLL